MTEIRVQITAEDLAELDELATSADKRAVQTEEVPTPPGIEPITALILIGAAGAVAKVVMDFFEKRRGGTVIDLRAEAAKQIYRTSDLPWGFVLVMTADGKVTVDVKDAPKEALERWITTIIEQAFSTVKSVADAATKSAIDGAKVTTEGATP